MRLRLAKPSDSNSIAQIHYNSREELTNGFFASVSKLFLIHYYKIVLNDPNSVVVCAEDNEGMICGFASSTLDAQNQFQNIGKHKLRLALALLPSILLKPRILFDALSRYASIRGKSDNQYVSLFGVRGEFWVWDSRNKDTIWAGVLNNAHLHVLKVLGAKTLRFEVNADNLNVINFSKRNGAEIIDRIVLSDGRERLIMCYDLVKKFGRK